MIKHLFQAFIGKGSFFKTRGKLETYLTSFDCPGGLFIKCLKEYIVKFNFLFYPPKSSKKPAPKMRDIKSMLFMNASSSKKKIKDKDVSLADDELLGDILNEMHSEVRILPGLCESS